MSKLTLMVVLTALLSVVSDAQYEERCSLEIVKAARRAQPGVSDNMKTIYKDGGITASSNGGGKGIYLIAGEPAPLTSYGSMSSIEKGVNNCTATMSYAPSDFPKTTDACFRTKQQPSQTECRNVNVMKDAECFCKAVTSTLGNLVVVCPPGTIGVYCGSIKQNTVEVSCLVGQAIRDVAERVNTFGDSICEQNIVAVIDAAKSVYAKLNTDDGICRTPDTPSVSTEAEFIAAVQDLAAKAFDSCWNYCEGFGL